MAIVWVVLFILIAAVCLAVATAGYRAKRHRSLYIDSPAWRERHWREEHERERAALEHGLEDHL